MKQAKAFRNSVRSLCDANVALNDVSVKKYHRPELYVDNMYTTSIDSNPFAKSLVRTNQEGSSTRFPIGSLLAVSPIKSDSYVITPFVDGLDPEIVAAPAYILANKKFIHTVEMKKMWYRYVSLKFKNYNGEVNCRPIPELSSVYRESLEERIKTRLASKEEHTDNEDGFFLRTTGNLIDIEKGKIYLNVPGIEEDVFVAFKGNDGLSYDILRLMRYYL